MSKTEEGSRAIECDAISVRLVTRPREWHSGCSLTVSGDGGNTEGFSCQPMIDTFVQDEHQDHLLVRVCCVWLRQRIKCYESSVLGSRPNERVIGQEVIASFTPASLLTLRVSKFELPTSISYVQTELWSLSIEDSTITRKLSRSQILSELSHCANKGPRQS